MSEFNPLVERVDALLKRHQQQPGSAPVPVEETPLAADAPPAAALPNEDDDIPVLTEIVEDPGLASPLAQVSASLQREIERAVLERVLGQLDRSLELRLNRTVGDLIEQVMDGLRAELSARVREMVHEAVASAIAAESLDRPAGPALPSPHD